MSSTTVNVCRTCLSTDGELISLFSGISDTAHLKSKIMNISDITINKKDGLPCMICKKCVFLVESFDCFKKQIESVNQKIKNLWQAANKESQGRERNFSRKIGNFTLEKEDEYDDSDYEIQYISDEVKKKVENAFKKKQEIARQMELAKICMTLRNYGDIILIPIKDTTDGKKKSGDPSREETNVQRGRSSCRKNADCAPNVTLFQFDEESLAKKTKDSWKNVHRFDEENSGEASKIESFYNDEAETVNSANSDCNERLTIEMEETDDASEKKHERGSAEAEVKSERETADDAKQKNVNPGRDLGEESRPVANSEDKRVDSRDHNHNKEKEDAGNPQNEKYRDNFAWRRNVFYHCTNNAFDQKQDVNSLIFGLARRRAEERIVKSLEVELEKQVYWSSKTLGRAKEDCSTLGKPHFYNEQVTPVENFANTIEKILQTMNVDGKNEKEVTATDNTFGIVEETVQTDKLPDNEEKTAENEKIDKSTKKDSRPEVPERNVAEVEKEAKKIDEDDEKRAQLNDREIDIGGSAKSIAAEKSDRIEDKIADTKVPASEDGNSKAVITGDKDLPDTSGKSASNDKVIVISSDTSDDERRRMHLEMANQAPSSSSRRARRKLFQARAGMKKNQNCQSQNRKSTSEAEKKQPPQDPKSFQPKKYFQCTNCKINLYSVSAVLYHHNQIHTPLQELLSCQMCDFKFPTKPELYAHFDQHVESHLFRCNFCTCEFVLKKNLHTHINAHMKPKIEEPESKKAKLEEPSKVEVPANETAADVKNSEEATGDRKMEVDGDTMDKAKDV